MPVLRGDDRFVFGAASVEHADTIADRQSKHAGQVIGFIDWEENSIAGDTCCRRIEPREGSPSTALSVA